MITAPTRRDFLRTTAIATGAALAAPYVKTAHSAGRLSVLAWDHWVPGENEAFREIVEAWSKTNNVEVTIDFQDDFDPTLAKEASERTGHDFVEVNYAAERPALLEPLDDIVQALANQYGPFSDNARYMAQHEGVWFALPTGRGSLSHPLASRLDLWKTHAGVDLQTMFPAGSRDEALVQGWTYAAFLQACDKLHAAGHPFGNAISPCNDSRTSLAALLAAFGSHMMAADGTITVRSDGTQAALEYMKELVEYMPKDVHEWDNSGNNKWLISGKGAGIFNAPSAWAVAKEDAPEVAAQVWHHDVPSGPGGRYRGLNLGQWGIWTFAENKQAAKDLLLHLGQKKQVDKLLWASKGYDVPPQASFFDHEVWLKEGPPAGTIYNYPVRGDEQLIVPGYPAPPSIAAKMRDANLIPSLVAKVTKEGKSPADAIAWAEGELEKITKA
jgi:ABC-type glycerol-3-phosphate transport system substrate-binding protein